MVRLPMLVVIELGQRRPVAGERPLHPKSHRPAQPGFAAGRIARDDSSGRGGAEAGTESGQILQAVAVAGPGRAALGVQQIMVEGIAEPGGRGCQLIGLGGQGYGIVVLAEKERIGGLAVDIGPGKIPLRSEHPIGCELVIAADLGAAEKAGTHVEGNRLPGRGEVLTDSAAAAVETGVGELLATPAGAHMAADIATGPGKRRRSLDRSLDPHGRKVGRQGRAAEGQRGARQ